MSPVPFHDPRWQHQWTRWRAELSPGDLATTLLYVGAGTGSHWTNPGYREEAPRFIDEVLEEVRHLQRMVVWVDAIQMHIEHEGPDPLKPYHHQAREFFAALAGEEFRIELRLEGRAQERDGLELLETLLRGKPAPRSHIALLTQDPARPRKWSWPLRVGTLPSKSADSWLPSLDALPEAWMREVMEISKLTGDRGAFDVLMVLGGLEAAIQSVLSIPRLPRVHTILVMGGGSRRVGWLDRLAFLRRQSGAGIVLWNPAPTALHARWFENWLAELCHDQLMDIAAARASRSLDLPDSLIIGTESLLAETRLAKVGRDLHTRASRMARSMSLDLTFSPPYAESEEGAGVGMGTGDEGAVPRPSPPIIKKEHLTRAEPPPSLAARAAEMMGLAGAMEDLLKPENVGAFVHETAGASGLARASRKVEEILKSAKPVSGRQRFVQVTVAEERDPQGEDHEGPLVPGQTYLVRTQIGFPGLQKLKYPIPLPEDQIPPSEDGHHLTVVFTAPGLTAQPQVQTLFLPKVGNSGVIFFLLPAGERNGPFRSRMLVLYRNRVLQTILMKGSVGEGEAIHFSAEFEDHALTEDLENHPNFDAALLFNHGEDGEPAATAVADGKAQWMPLSGTLAAAFPAKVQSLLDQLTSDSWGLRPLSDPKVQELLGRLARSGSEVYQILIKDLRLDESLARNGRIQILAANPDSVFPVEFLYDGPPPDHQTAVVCPHAQNALLGQDAGCPTPCADHPDLTRCPFGTSVAGDLAGLANAKVCPGPTVRTICPFAFWGIQKVLERQVFDPAQSAGQSPENIRIQAGGSPDTKQIAVFHSILLGASERATNSLPTALDGLVAAIDQFENPPISVLTQWNHWVSSVQQRNPSLLILVAHTEMNDEDEAILEIGNDDLPRASIDTCHVKGFPNSTPMVWLLGCSTAATARDVTSMVGAFRRGGAPIVVGTLAPTLGRQVGPVAESFFRTLSDELKTGPVELGEVMRHVRRSLVATGQLAVLNLVAFGDSDWELV